MADHECRNKLRFAKLEKEMNSMRRDRAIAGPEYSISSARSLPESLESKRGVIGALLPIVSQEGYFKRMKHEYVRSMPNIKCSLDYLAVIANEQARYETELEGNSSDLSDDTDNDDINVESDDNEHDDDEYEEVYDEEVKYIKCRQLPAETLHVARGHYTSREADAAAALLMASFAQHYQVPRKRRRANADDGGGSLRSRRLSQNQLYRKRLHDKGVYPIRQGARRYVCSLCSEVFVKEMFVWRHGAKHLESKPFQCTLCSGKFNRSDSLQRHVRNFHRKE